METLCLSRIPVETPPHLLDQLHQIWALKVMLFLVATKTKSSAGVSTSKKGETRAKKGEEKHSHFVYGFRKTLGLDSILISSGSARTQHNSPLPLRCGTHSKVSGCYSVLGRCCVASTSGWTLFGPVRSRCSLTGTAGALCCAVLCASQRSAFVRGAPEHGGKRL